jgi:hypothetical protein
MSHGLRVGPITAEQLERLLPPMIVEYQRFTRSTWIEYELDL